MLIFNFDNKSRVKHLVFKANNFTLFYKGFNELVILMTEFTDALSAPSQPLIQISEHQTTQSAKENYHNGIDVAYTDDGHFHFERKDAAPINKKDVRIFLDLCAAYKLLTKVEITMVYNAYCRATYHFKSDSPEEKITFEIATKESKRSRSFDIDDEAKDRYTTGVSANDINETDKPAKMLFKKKLKLTLFEQPSKQDCEVTIANASGPLGSISPTCD